MSHIKLTRPSLEVGYAIFCALVAENVNRIVPEPYMDEIFHVPQAQAYCQGKWTQWDPALTTPPGIYLVSISLSRVLSLIGLPAACSSTAFLRSTNLILYLLLPHLLSSILKHISSKYNASQETSAPPVEVLKQTMAALEEQEDIRLQSSVQAHAIASFPPLWLFAFLYYTDVGSLFMVFLSYWASLKRRPLLSAAAGIASLSFRQTNIIWIAFIMWARMIEELRQHGLQDPPASQLTRKGAMRLAESVVSLLSNSTAWKAVFSISGPYLPVFASFAAFLKWNGGIVLGDKTNHVAGVHLPQMCYFVAASALFAWPTLLFDGGISPLRKLRRTVHDLICSPIASLFGLTIILVAIHRFTIFHPFTLADNRHYVFYARRYILDPHPYARYALAPVYLLCFKLWYDHLKHTQSLLWIAGLAGSTALVLVPSPLIEPRYFLVPFVFMRLHGAIFASCQQASSEGNDAEPKRKRSSSNQNGVLELAWNTVINIATICIFLYRPFKWPAVEGHQRFMW